MPDVPQMNFRRDFGQYKPDKQEQRSSVYWRPGPRKKKPAHRVSKEQAAKIQDDIIARKLRWIKDDQ
jgi:hypothetical protein